MLQSIYKLFKRKKIQVNNNKKICQCKIIKVSKTVFKKSNFSKKVKKKLHRNDKNN